MLMKRHQRIAPLFEDDFWVTRWRSQEKMIQKTKAAMQKAAKELDFIEAARLRDEMFQLEKKRDEMK